MSKFTRMVIWNFKYLFLIILLIHPNKIYAYRGLIPLYHMSLYHFITKIAKTYFTGVDK